MSPSRMTATLNPFKFLVVLNLRSPLGLVITLNLIDFDPLFFANIDKQAVQCAVYGKTDQLVLKGVV